MPPDLSQVTVGTALAAPALDPAAAPNASVLAAAIRVAHLRGERRVANPRSTTTGRSYSAVSHRL